MKINTLTTKKEDMGDFTGKSVDAHNKEDANAAGHTDPNGGLRAPRITSATSNGAGSTHGASAVVVAVNDSGATSTIQRSGSKVLAHTGARVQSRNTSVDYNASGTNPRSSKGNETSHLTFSSLPSPTGAKTMNTQTTTSTIGGNATRVPVSDRISELLRKAHDVGTAVVEAVDAHRVEATKYGKMLKDHLEGWSKGEITEVTPQNVTKSGLQLSFVKPAEAMDSSTLIGMIVNCGTDAAITRHDMKDWDRTIAIAGACYEPAADHKDSDAPIPKWLSSFMSNFYMRLTAQKAFYSHARRKKIAEKAAELSVVDMFKKAVVEAHRRKYIEVGSSGVQEYTTNLFTIAGGLLGVELVEEKGYGLATQSNMNKLNKAYKEQYPQGLPKGYNLYVKLHKMFADAGRTFSAYLDQDPSRKTSSKEWKNKAEKIVEVIGDALLDGDLEQLVIFSYIGVLCDPTLNNRDESPIDGRGWGLFRYNSNLLAICASDDPVAQYDLVGDELDPNGKMLEQVLQFVDEGRVTRKVVGADGTYREFELDLVKQAYEAMDPVMLKLVKIPGSYKDEQGEWHRLENLRISGKKIADVLKIAAQKVLGGDMPEDFDSNDLYTSTVISGIAPDLSNADSLMLGSPIKFQWGVKKLLSVTGEEIVLDEGDEVVVRVARKSHKLPKRFKALRSSNIFKGRIRKGAQWKMIESLSKEDANEALIIAHPDDVGLRPGVYVATRGFIKGLGILKGVLRVYNRATKGTILYTEGSFKTELEVVVGSSAIMATYKFESSEDETNSSDLWNEPLMEAASLHHIATIEAIGQKEVNAAIDRKQGTIALPILMATLAEEVVGNTFRVQERYNWKLPQSIKLFGRPAVEELGEEVAKGTTVVLRSTGEILFNPEDWLDVAVRCGGCDLDDVFRITEGGVVRVEKTGKELMRLSVLRNPKGAGDGVYAFTLAAVYGKEVV